MKRKFQIFISSTFEDLKDDRQAAVSAVLKAGHIPAGMELFTSGDKSQMETIRKWIDESDIYMLILGGRYGSIEPSSGVSYTELEYDYALEQDKPLFSVVIDDDALEARIKNDGSQMMEKDNPKQLRQFREKVLSNVSSFFEDSKDIKLCVHESLADFAYSRELTGWIPANELTKIQPLLEEIGHLNEENNTLKEELSNAKKRISDSSNKTTTDDTFNDLIKILKAIEVDIPPSVSNGKKGITNSLFDIFISNKETFVTGVTNQIDSGEAASFLYHNVCPKLQIHGLVLNEKVASVRWRRFSMTKKGNEFLAFYEKKTLLSK